MKTIFIFLLLIIVKSSFSQLVNEWALRFDDPTLSYVQKGRLVEVDDDGNIWSAGAYKNQIKTDSSNLLNAIAEYDIYVTKHNPNGDLLVSFSIGGTGNDYINEIAFDNENNLYLLGTYELYADFDPSFDVVLLGPAINTNGFVAKYDTNGNLIFAKSINSSYKVFPNAIDFDKKNSSIIGGYYHVNADVDPSGVDYLLAGESTTATNIFITKWNENGEFIKGGSIGKNSKQDELNDILITDDQKVYCVGKASGNVDFDIDSTNYIIGTSTALNKAFVAKFDTLLNIEKAHIFGGGGDNYGIKICANHFNQIVIGFNLNGSMSYSTDSIITITPAFGSFDYGVATFDNNLNLISGNTIGGISNEYITDMAIDEFNFIHVCGTASDSFDADPSPDSVLITTVFDDGFLFEYDPNCNLMNSFFWSAPSLQRFNNLAINFANEIYLTGEFSNQIKLDPTTNIITFSGSFSTDAFIAKYAYLNVGINEIESTLNKINFYPNPGYDLVTISQPINKAKLFSLDGNLVTETSYQTIDVSQLQNGLYLLVVDDDFTNAVKLIVQH